MRLPSFEALSAQRSERSTVAALRHLAIQGRDGRRRGSVNLPIVGTSRT